MSQLTKYLTNYAQPEVALLADFPAQLSYCHVVVIPAYKESSAFAESFIQSQLAQQNVLMIVVINQPLTDPDPQAQQQLVNEILQLGQVRWLRQNLSLVEFSKGNSACLIVDRFTNRIVPKQGVGLARKIGCDLACQLIEQHNITATWVHSTDADATLPDNYFTELTGQLAAQEQNPVAACYNFCHHSKDIEVHLANQLYEQALRYYVAGLRYANSRYSFFTIGSILAFKATAYASVRGFPKKSAGEDFYLLNKLAKMGQVLTLGNATIELTARTSDRVPFGTGPAVQQIITQQLSAKNYCYYHPEIFNQLKLVNVAFEGLFEQITEVMNWYQMLDDKAVLALQSLGFEAFIIKQAKSNQRQFYKQLNVWFDAFKTLKFIHYLRDNFYPNISLADAIELANFELNE